MGGPKSGLLFISPLSISITLYLQELRYCLRLPVRLPALEGASIIDSFCVSLIAM